MLAAAAGHTEVMTLLLTTASQQHKDQVLIDSGGAQVDQVKAGGVTALMQAAKNGHISVVRALLQAGATVNQPKSDGVTALMYAALHGHTDIVQTLIDAEANCKLKKANGETALSLAIKGKHEGVIALLRRHGADTSS